MYVLNNITRFFLLLLFMGCAILACDSKEEPKPGGGPSVDETVSVSIQDLSIDEGNSNKNIFVRVQLSGASTENNTVYFSSKAVTASAGEDFTEFSNESLVFAPGELIKDYKIALIGDEDFEADETFEVVIDRVDGNATIDKGTAVITIVNDDEGETMVNIPSSGASSPTTYSNMSLIWQDEFNDTGINESDWTFEIGNGNNGWGNEELQFYKKDNASIIDGKLVIEAKKELNGQYTSTRMITKNKFDFQFGRVDIRAALPSGQGIWPALWMLGSNISTVGWPSCGEIDIMEIVGHEPNQLHGTAHWSNGNGDHTFTGDHIQSSTSLKNEFNVYSVIWEDGKITWLLNDVQYNTLSTTNSDLSEFNSGNFFFIFNVAVGGKWPGSPDSSTQFPQHMIVDYIRVFQ